MPFVTLQEVLQNAQQEGYAVGAFNANNMEIVKAIIEAAVEERSPVILQASQGAPLCGLKHITAMVRAAAGKRTFRLSCIWITGQVLNRQCSACGTGFLP